MAATAKRKDLSDLGPRLEDLPPAKTGTINMRMPVCYQELWQPYRYKILYGGRGAGRSWSIARTLLVMGTRKPMLILCTRELQKSIKGSVYRLLRNQIKIMGLQSHYPDHMQSGTTIRGINDTEFVFYGTRYNADEIRSTEGIDVCWIEEAHNLTEDGWDVITPTIRKAGSEIWASFNTRFKSDTLYDKFVVKPPPPNSLIIHSNFTDNPYISQELLDEQAFMRETDYENWLHHWKGHLRELAKGAIFGKQITEVKKGNRLVHIPVEKSCEVETFNDVGKNDPCAWWLFQNAGGQLRFIDYYHNRFEDIDHYVRVLKALGYNYGRHFMPHDAGHERLGMTRTIAEQFEDGGIRPVEIVPRVQDKDIGIQLARDIMGKCWFHHGDDGDRPEQECEGYIPWLEEGWRTRAQRMEQGWSMLCQYRYVYNDNTGEWGRKPHHGIESNGADAFMQFAQSYEPPEGEDWFTKSIPASRSVR